MPQRIGIVGGGQLGRFLALAAQKLGYQVTILDATPESPAGLVADNQIVGDVKDPQAIRRLAGKVDYLTFEIELANSEILEELARTGVRIAPSGKTLRIIKDKLRQKEFLRERGIPVANFRSIESTQDILKTAQDFGFPFLLKARTDAYDGRGNALIESSGAVETALAKLAGRKLYAEKFVPFEKEIAINVARNLQGETATHPLVETVHQNNICHIVKAASLFSEAVQAKATGLATAVMNHLGGAGLFSIEMFLTPDGEVLVNEIAPRVHNSGHYTLEACVTSQFEQHIRAITGLPLGKTDMKFPAAVMVNILGDRSGPVLREGLEAAASLENVQVHMYGKKETRPERKMGHITVVGANLEEILEKALYARSIIHV